MKLRVPIAVSLVGLSACGTSPVSGGAPPAAVVPGGVRVVAAVPGQSTPSEVVVPATNQSLALVVYPSQPSLIRDTRPVNLPAGGVTLRFTGVSPQLDPTSARLLAPGSEVIPAIATQTFSGEGVTTQRLLEHYVGKTVEVKLTPVDDDHSPKVVEATLLSVDGPVVKIGDKVYLKPPGELILPGVPAGMATGPALTWRLSSESGYTGALEANYLARGLSWQADYALTLDSSGDRAELASWATLTNQTGVDLPEARLTVVAGAVQRLGHPRPPFYRSEDSMANTGGGGGFSTSPLDVFHRYDLAGRVTLLNQTTQQLPLLKTVSLAVDRRLRFESHMGQIDETPRAALSTLSFRNEAAVGLGVPLAQGRVRVYRATALVGEDLMPNTPKDELVRVKLGDAFDVVGERKQTAVSKPAEKVREESYAVTLRNHRATPVVVDVVEHPYGAWTISGETQPYKRVSATEIVFSVTVPANNDARVLYTIRFKEE